MRRFKNCPGRASQRVLGLGFLEEPLQGAPGAAEPCACERDRAGVHSNTVAPAAGSKRGAGPGPPAA